MQSRKIPLFTGLTYHVLEWGTQTPGDLTFVLLHGFADLGAMWSDVAERLAPHGHVVAPDFRGHGDSDWIGPGGYYHVMDYLADIDDLIAQVARPRLVLVGHSMGGSVSSYYAGMRPERLTALALLEGLGLPDMSTLDGPSRTSGWIEAWRTARGNDRPRRVIASIEEAASRLRRHDDKLDEAQARRFAELGTRKVEGGYTWKYDPLHQTAGPYAFRLDVAIKYWQRVTCPVLFIDGADSQFPLPPEERARRRALFARHRHVVVDNAGHAIARHQPARVAELILELIA